jgi:hypothetical protein
METQPFRILDPATMAKILAIADRAGVSREALRVPLAGEGDGRIERDERGTWQIVLPAAGPLDDFLARLDRALGAGAAPGAD